MFSYVITNITDNETHVVVLHSEDSMKQSIGDQLYVFWELTPATYNWYKKLLTGERVRFSYHGLEFVEVWGENGQLWVRDCE